MNEAAVTQRMVDADTGEAFYSVVSIVPSRQAVWGSSAWRAGRTPLPADRSLKPGAPLSPDQTSQQSGHKTLGKVQTEHFDLTQPGGEKQAPKIKVKRRRVFTVSDVQKSVPDTVAAAGQPVSDAAARQAVVSAFGEKATSALEREGLLNFVSSPCGFPAEIHPLMPSESMRPVDSRYSAWRGMMSAQILPARCLASGARYLPP